MRTSVIIPSLQQLNEVASDNSPTYLSSEGYSYSIRQSDDWKFYLVFLIREDREMFRLDYDEEDTIEQLVLSPDPNSIVCRSLYDYASFYSSIGCNVKTHIASLLSELRTRLSRVTEDNLAEVCAWIVQLVTDLNRFDIEKVSMIELGDKLHLLIDECMEEGFLNLLQDS